MKQETGKKRTFLRLFEMIEIIIGLLFIGIIALFKEYKELWDYTGLTEKEREIKGLWGKCRIKYDKSKGPESERERWNKYDMGLK